MTGRRLKLGRDLDLVRKTTDGLDLEGPVRLRPGQLVDLIEADHGEGRGVGGRAKVQSWSVVQLGSSGPIYSGHCAWHDAGGS